jgi:hypothetical protein
MAANLTGLFGQLNESILRDPLNQAFDFSVAGMPSRPMDSVNPMLRNAAQGIGSAMGVEAGQLQTSEQAVEARKASHKEALIARAEELDLPAVAAGIKAGGSIKDYLPQILAAEQEQKAREGAELAYQRKIEQADAQVDRDIMIAKAKGDISLANKLAEQKAAHGLKRANRGYQVIGGKVMLTNGHGRIIGDAGMSPKEFDRMQEQAQKDKEATEKEYTDLETQAKRSADVQADIDLVRSDVKAAGGTGLITLAQSKISSSKSATLDHSLRSMQAKMTLDVMSALKEMSATGSTGFGALSANELQVLQDAIVSLDIGMNTQDFERSLARVERDYAEVRKEFEHCGGVSTTSALAEPKTPKLSAAAKAML